MILENTSELSSGSHKKVRIRCDFEISEKCRKEYELKYKDIFATKSYKEEKLICCLPCAMYIRNENFNSNRTLKLDFFEEIDTEEKSYILGLIASDGYINEKTIFIYQNTNSEGILEKIKNILCCETSIKRDLKKEISYLYICSKKYVTDICYHLNISPGKKSNVIDFPKLPSEEITWHFIRGFFDGDGSIRKIGKKPSPDCSIVCASEIFRKKLKEFCPYPCKENRIELYWNGVNCIDFLGCLYKNSSIHLVRKYNQYIDWCLWQPMLSGKGNKGKIDEIFWYKTKENAVPPFKERISDSGYDLTLIEKVNVIGKVEMYDTGIKVTPPYGFYFDLVPRSSIIKTGYMLANSVGIIDRSYTGTILVPLLKINDNTEKLQLPSRCVQLILRPIIHVNIIEKTIVETGRGNKGFGESTGT